MSSQPAEHDVVRPIGNPSIPQFEGLPVTSARFRISGLGGVNVDGVVVGIDDVVRLIGEYRCIAVRHIVDPKTGEVVREQVLSPLEVDTCPFDPSNQADDGVLRARK